MKKLMNTCLAHFDTMPTLVNGKVVIFHPERNGYKRHSVAKSVKIEDNFDPMDYSILNHPKYNECIVYSTQAERDDVAINQYWKKRLNIRIGDKIHVRFRRGIYTVIGIRGNELVISCQNWKTQGLPDRTIKLSDFVAFAGGLHSTRVIRG